MKKKVMLLGLLCCLSNFAFNQVLNKDVEKLSMVVTEGCRLEYFLKDTLKVPNHFIITAPDSDTIDSKTFYSNFHLYYYSENIKLTEVKVYSCKRYRDGGTTILKTQVGEFYFPPVITLERVPTLTEPGSAPKKLIQIMKI